MEEDEREKALRLWGKEEGEHPLFCSPIQFGWLGTKEEKEEENGEGAWLLSSRDSRVIN